MPIDEVLKNIDAIRAKGIGGIKIKVGQPDLSIDVARVAQVRKLLGRRLPADGGRQPAMGPAQGAARLPRV